MGPEFRCSQRSNLQRMPTGKGKNRLSPVESYWVCQRSIRAGPVLRSSWPTENHINAIFFCVDFCFILLCLGLFVLFVFCWFVLSSDFVFFFACFICLVIYLRERNRTQSWVGREKGEAGRGKTVMKMPCMKKKSQSTKRKAAEGHHSWGEDC